MTSRVVVVGSVNVDLVVRVPSLPGPGETVVGRRLDWHGGGKSANAAVAAARAGAEVSFVGAVGADDLGREALAALAPVDVSHVAVLDGESTGAALIAVSADGENQIAVGAGANAALTAAHVTAALAELLPSAGCVLVGTEVSLDAALVAVSAARAAGVPCVLDPAPVVPGIEAALADGPILTPNAGECRELALRAGLAASSPSDAAAALAGVTGSAVVVTLGADGILLVTPAAEPVHIPPIEVDVVDTTGAGDTVTGTLAAHLALGASLADAARAANSAGAVAVTRPGAR